jgi:glycolate oxidase FAD binding subunit
VALSARNAAAPIDPAGFALGGLVPRKVSSPATIGALARALRESDAAGERVVLYGGGTLQDIGNPPQRYDGAISLARLNRVIDYEPRDLTISVEAGITLGAISKRLARNKQCLPLDAPLPGQTTAGGVLASGWSGPRRLVHGRPRDFVIGATVVLADGTVSSSGGRVVKNVSGYDVAKLFAGSLGTLGAIATLNFKTIPLPAAQRLALCRLPERTRERAFTHLEALAHEPSAALHVWGFDEEIDGHDGIDGRLLLLFEGSEEAVDLATREMRSSLGAAGVPETSLSDTHARAIYQRAIDAYVSKLAGRSASFRVPGDPSSISERLAELHRSAEAHSLRSETIADLRCGDVLLRVSAETSDEFPRAALPFAGALHDAFERVTLLAAPIAFHPRITAWGSAPPAIDHMRRLKSRFDPRGTLAPGRLIGGI